MLDIVMPVVYDVLAWDFIQIIYEDIMRNAPCIDETIIIFKISFSLYFIQKSSRM